MATCRDSKPNDPMYSEGPQSYSPHWARPVVKPASPKPPTQPKGRLIDKGSVPDTDPRYSSGWNYLSGKNLNLPPPPEQQASTEQQPEQSSKTRVFRNLSPAELREHGVPIRNDLVISPVPRDPRKQEDR